MRSQFLLVPAALIATAPAYADTFLTVERAQQLIFPGATFEKADFNLSEMQVEELMAKTQATVFRSKVAAWKFSTGGWFLLDQVPGRDDRVTYAIGIGPDGKLKSVEILICLPAYGRVREYEWRDQFKGRRHGEGGDLMNEISNITGSTLTVGHIAEGVKRLLATYALFMERKNAG